MADEKKPSEARTATTVAATEALTQFARFIPQWAHGQFTAAAMQFAEVVYENGRVDGYSEGYDKGVQDVQEGVVG